MGVAKLLTVALLSLTLHGKPVGKTGATVDGERLEAAGAAAADLRAPSAEIARIRAERAARGRAEARLVQAMTELGAQLSDDEKRTRAAAAESTIRYGSDGSVELKLTLSLRGVSLKPMSERALERSESAGKRAVQP